MVLDKYFTIREAFSVPVLLPFFKCPNSCPKARSAVLRIVLTNGTYRSASCAFCVRPAAVPSHSQAASLTGTRDRSVATSSRPAKYLFKNNLWFCNRSTQCYSARESPFKTGFIQVSRQRLYSRPPSLVPVFQISSPRYLILQKEIAHAGTVGQWDS